MIEFILALFLALIPGNTNNTTTNDDGTPTTIVDDGDTGGETGSIPNKPPTKP